MRNLFFGQLTQDACSRFNLVGGDSRTVVVAEEENGLLFVVATTRQQVRIIATIFDFEGRSLLSVNTALQAISLAV